MYLIMLTVAVRTTARSSLAVFFNFIHLFLFKGRIGPERLEAKRDGRKDVSHIRAHSHSEPQTRRSCFSPSLSLFAPVCSKQKKHTNTHTHTRGFEKGPVSWLYLT